MRRPRLTVRVRLTALFALAYLAVAVILIVVNYVVVSNRLDGPEADAFPSGFGRDDIQIPDGLSLPGDIDVDDLPGLDDLLLPDGTTVADAVDNVRDDIVDDTLSTLLQWSIVATVLSLIPAVALGYWTSGRALAPVRQVSATARRLSEVNLAERVGYDGPADELQELASTFDSMLDRLQRAVDSQRQFTAMASHELRTPLARITAASDLTLDNPGTMSAEELANTVRPAAEEASHLVNQLLDLMRSQAIMGTAPVDLAAAWTNVVAEAEPAATDQGIELDLSVIDSPTVMGDAILLAAQAGNVVDNALRHNHHGGTVHIEIRRHGADAVVRCENTGAVLTAAQVDRISEPFQRGTDNPDQLGHGLGTSIVRAIARSHGGTLHMQPRADGGLVVELRLPVATAPAPPAMS